MKIRKWKDMPLDEKVESLHRLLQLIFWGLVVNAILIVLQKLGAINL